SAHATPSANDKPLALDDDEIVRRAKLAKNGSKFKQLWAGNISGHASHSEADAALCRMLAFYCGPDAARIDELFRSSGLYRPKWDRRDYRDATIALALSGRRDFYRPRRTLQCHRRQAFISFSLEVR